MKDIAGTIVLADDPRPDAPAVVAWLRETGVSRVAMFTGDVGATAQSVATAVGIDEVHAELTAR